MNINRASALIDRCKVAIMNIKSVQGYAPSISVTFEDFLAVLQDKNPSEFALYHDDVIFKEITSKIFSEFQGAKQC